MRKIVGIALSGFALLFSLKVQAQSYTETALLFSRSRPGGSARIQAMGGVQNSLGGDYSSAYSNPAGLGMYNRSEFTFTPAFNSAATSSDYLGEKTSDSKSRLILPGLSFVFHSNKEGKLGFLGGTFGITFNRINDFNRSFTYQGANASSSIIDYFLADASGTNVSQFDTDGFNYNSPTGLAYFNYLISPQSLYPGGDPTLYFSDVNGNPIKQGEEVESSRAQNQWSISYGANLGDKVFLGGGIGVTSLNYKSKKTFYEEFKSDTLRSLSLEENLSVSGSGINATIGAIVRPIDFVQLGISVTTPTSYQITDNYSASMSSKWNSFTYKPGTILTDEDAQTDVIITDYNLATPFRLNGGITLFIQKHGFISADVDYLDYGNTKYRSNTTGVSFTEDNTDIKALYKSAVNYRIGGEYRFKEYRVRGGYAFMPDPFKAPQNGVDRKTSSFSTGFGYRKQNFFLDVAVVYTQGNASYRPYRINSALSPLVKTDNKNTLVMVTLGFPF